LKFVTTKRDATNIKVPLKVNLFEQIAQLLRDLVGRFAG